MVINTWIDKEDFLKRFPWSFKWLSKQFFYWSNAFSVPFCVITSSITTSEFFHHISILFLHFIWVKLYKWYELYSFVPGFFCSSLSLEVIHVVAYSNSSVFILLCSVTLYKYTTFYLFCCLWIIGLFLVFSYHK